ncbi:palmitoyltransferase SWF1, putative [Entamoeba dispar SAW760]|uniref:Palmitoyltransferase n=1 Tax=Entamoeba dispar (strain ATCC PRA-260 / SAW760) TaxID=370354 RepID=B0ESQ6_ENTDS|nr:palmitoyltransferase SWF1, putative [Entamoeba dispar SAW760]EDR22434.1 palmitoyltransferase SWF1, putative [Entamoeba dispar SAW760]|eukprot:EDR22434.1 palmitoyltransferase SWF1, putative [Entamoeba dispar SAW760]
MSEEQQNIQPSISIQDTKIADMENVEDTLGRIQGLPGIIAKKLLIIVKYIWIMVPCLLVITYILCVYFIMKYFYFKWSWGEKIFWFYFELHYTYYQIFWSFFKCHFTKPKKIDLGYERNLLYDTEEICSVCNKPRAARTHHCGFCKKCITKYDHHCSWMSACIGYHNARYFFLFMVGCFRGMLICDTHLWYIWKMYYSNDNFPFWTTLLLSLFFFNITMVMIFQVILNSICFSLNLTMMELVVYLGQCIQKKSIFISLPYYKSLSENWHEALHLPKHLPIILGLIPYDFQNKEYQD